MAVRTHSKIIGAFIHDISSCVGIVVGSQGFLRDFNFHGFACSRCKFTRFGKSAEFNSRFFDEIRAVIIRIGRLHINLYNIFACSQAVIRDGNLCGKGILVFGERIITVREIGVAQAVTERILHLCCIIIVPCIAQTEHSVFITCLVIAIADVNAFTVNREGIFGAFFVVGIRELAVIKDLGSRCTQSIIGIGIHQPA